MARTPPFCKKMEQDNANRIPQAKKRNRDAVSFSIVIQTTHVSGDYRVAMPSSFAGQYLTKWRGKLTLHSEDGKTWPVGYVSVYMKKHIVVRVCRGWKKFVVENHLEVGDKCVFEAIDHKATKLKIAICRENQDARPSPPIGNSKNMQHKHNSPSEKAKAKLPIRLPSRPIGQVEGIRKQTIKKESRCKEQNLSFTSPPEAADSSFIAQIVPECLKHRRMHVPKSFVKNMEPGPKAAMLEVNCRLWPVTLLIDPNPVRGQLSLGWDSFARDNSLKLGDVCTFEMINKSDQLLLIDVSITRISDVCFESNGDDEIPRKRKEKSQSSSSCCHKKMKKTVPFTNTAGKDASTRVNQNFRRLHDQKHIAETIDDSKKLTSGNPFFKVVIRSSHFEGQRLNVPHYFFKNLQQTTQNAKLLLYGKTWPVRLLFYPNRRQGTLSGGWLDFARQSSLKAGDVCTFQLISIADQTPLINVSIMRTSGEAELQVPKVEETAFEIPDEVSGQFSSSRKRKDKSALSSSQPRKKTKKVENFTQITGKGKSKQSMAKENGTKCLGKPSSLNPLEVAKKHTTPFFKVVMTSKQIKGSSDVNVPLKFIKNLNGVTQIVRLKVENRIWPTELIVYPHHAKSMFSRWACFARANSLKVGDVCSFELIDTQNLLIKVSISRNMSRN